MASDRRNPRSQPPHFFSSRMPPVATPTPQIPPHPPELLLSADDLGKSSSSSSWLMVSRRDVCCEVGGERSRSGACSGENAITELASRWGISAEDAISSSGNVEPTRQIVDYLLVLYLVNAPVKDLSTFCRILFLIEEAHRTYQDDFWARFKCLRPYKELKDFTKFIFGKCDFLTCYISDFENIFDNFEEYKSHITSCGAIILDDSFEKCLLVKGLGNSDWWGFPKGKRGKDEKDWECAIRKVKEEIGYDISANLSSEHVVKHIANHLNNEKVTLLYLIPGVKHDTRFATTKRESCEIGWHRLKDMETMQIPNKGFFLSYIKDWITKNASSPARIAPRGRGQPQNGDHEDQEELLR